MGNEWKIEVPGYGLLRLSSQLLIMLSEFIQDGIKKTESGGVLIGKHLNSGGTLLIDGFTPPQKSDKQGRHSYYRSAAHNKIIQNIWKKSDRHTTYVGLWHTHPEPIPNFSPVDKRDWLNALEKSKFEGNRLYFIIVGQTHIRCWVGTKLKFRNKIELLGEYEIGK